MKKLKIGVLLTAFVLTLSCTDKTVNQTTQILPLLHTLGVVSQGYDYYSDTLYTACWAYVFNAQKSWPLVTLNNDTLPGDLSDFYYPDESFYYRKSGLTLVSGTSYTMKVVDREDVSQATVIHSGPLVVTVPDSVESCLDYGNPLTVAWNKNLAQWYLFQFYWRVTWQDTVTYSYRYTYLDTLLVTTDTGYTASADWLWPTPPGPNWVPTYWYGGFYVTAGSGPKPLPGSVGNFTGAGTGFLVAISSSRSYYIDPCSPILSAGHQEKNYGRPDEEIRKLLLQRFGINASQR